MGKKEELKIPTDTGAKYKGVLLSLAPHRRSAWNWPNSMGFCFNCQFEVTPTIDFEARAGAMSVFAIWTCRKCKRAWRQALGEANPKKAIVVLHDVKRAE